jgi:hypothetical protein
MRFIVNTLLFLLLVSFCFYWFNDGNPDRNDPTKIPYVGDLLTVANDKYAEVRFYIDSNQGNLWDYLENSSEIRTITEKLTEIYEAARGHYQP